MDYAALKAEIEAGPLASTLAPMVAAGDDVAVAAALNAKTITAKGTVTTHDIRQYLMLVDLLLTIENTATPTCIATKRALEVFPVFDLSNPWVIGKFSQILDGLVAETLIPDFSETHKATILGMADTLVSRAEQVFGQSVNHIDVAIAMRGGV